MLNAHRAGAGEPLVLLHGIGMRWQWWLPCLPALASEHDVVAVDLPGFGESPPLAPGDEPTPVRLALAVEELIGELGLGQPRLAGISLGALVALELAKQGAASAVCAISPPGFMRSWERAWARASLRATSAISRRAEPHAGRLCARRNVRVALFAEMTGRPWRIPAGDAAGALRAAARSDFDRTLPHATDEDFGGGDAIEVPVTIAWGSRDRLLFPWQADRAVARIPLARKVVLHGCGHVPTYDDPALVAAAVLGQV